MNVDNATFAIFRDANKYYLFHPETNFYSRHFAALFQFENLSAFDSIAAKIVGHDNVWYNIQSVATLSSVHLAENPPGPSNTQKPITYYDMTVNTTATNCNQLTCFTHILILKLPHHHYHFTIVLVLARFEADSGGVIIAIAWNLLCFVSDVHSYLVFGH